ncbi:MAG: DUF364 domain-containing protein [Dehalococcoidales bacterium]|jgi:uncharacterized protein (DUF4213/DUF364 family)|nr:DUF364 domain-containing protein [Dehalococcoidales bacterium]MDD3995061.1 DUF364 domain-containing protein [Dehalococcoidales bacterium]
MAELTAIEVVRSKLVELVKENKAEGQPVVVTVGALSPLQAIGNTERQDYAILEGSEVMIQAQFGGGYGQAFTDSPKEFEGSIEDVLSFDLDTNSNRAIMVATLNAIASHLGIASGVIHCRDEEPAKCGDIIVEEVKKKYGDVKIGMIGLQPAILESLAKGFGADNVRCTDMNPKNIGQNKAGVIIWDGKTQTQEMISWCDIIFATGSTIANGSFDDINQRVKEAGKKLVLFGITGASVCAITGIDRICPYGH